MRRKMQREGLGKFGRGMIKSRKGLIHHRNIKLTSDESTGSGTNRNGTEEGGGLTATRNKESADAKAEIQTHGGGGKGTMIHAGRP